jgi:hypothetical protein
MVPWLMSFEVGTVAMVIDVGETEAKSCAKTLPAWGS